MKIKDVYLLILIVLLIGLALILSTPSIHGYDGVLNYAYFRSFFFDGDLDFTNDYRTFDSIKNYDYKFSDVPVSEQTQRPANRYGIGNSLLWAPFLILIHILILLLNLLGFKYPADGFSAAYAIGVGLGSVVYASAGLALLFVFLKKRFGNTSAFLAILTIWLTTPLIFYMYFHPSMSHANSFFLAVAFVVIYFRIYELRHSGKEGNQASRLPWLYGLLGCIAALLILTRFQDTMFLVLPLTGELSLLLKKKDNQPGRLNTSLAGLAIFAVCFFVIFLPQLFTWKYIYGSYLAGPVPYLAHKEFNLLRPIHLLQVLFSPLHGLFYWHPWLILGLVGLMLIERGKRTEALLLGLIFLAQLYLISCWDVWYAGASFGHRMFISSLLVFAYGLAALFYYLRSRVKPWLIGLALLLIFLWHGGLLVQYGTEMIPREHPISYSTLIKNQFTRVPTFIINSSLKRISGKRIQP